MKHRALAGTTMTVEQELAVWSGGLSAAAKEQEIREIVGHLHGERLIAWGVNHEICVDGVLGGLH